MRKNDSIRTVLALAALAWAGAAGAQEAKPEHTLGFNIGAVSDYRYRGISQTRLQPALQGGVDYAHKSGFYIGSWASTIKWIEDTGDIAPRTHIDGPVELDIYGGYKFNAGPVAFDLGALRYQYVGNDLQDAGGGGLFKNADTTELYAAGTWGPATLKYSHSLTNLFGNYNFATNEDSKGSGYLDLSATVELPWWGLTLTPHVGRQRVNHLEVASYTDYALTLGKDFGNGFSASLAAIGTDADKSYYASPANGKFLGRSGAVVGAKYNF